MQGKPNAMYLDVGVGGSGYTVIEAARKGWRSVGLDISPEGVAKAKEFAFAQLGEGHDVCDFVVSSAEHLPFRTGTFSKMSTISVLEHIPNDERAIIEMSRVLKPSGRVMITVPNAYQRMLPIFWMPYFLWDKAIGHLRHYKSEELIAKLSQGGFSTRRVSYSGHVYKILQVLLSRLFVTLRRKESRLWWTLEEMDLKMERVSSGLQLHLLVEKTSTLFSSREGPK
jgi:SAM-dependent methyltransferase